MKHAETVTFGGSALDRAGEVRAYPEAVEQAWRDPGARAVVFWRGKPLVATSKAVGLSRLPLDHPLLVDAAPDAVLLGREEGAPRWAFDLSSWTPEGVDASQLGGFSDPSEQRHPACAEDCAFLELRRIMTVLSPRDAELAATGKAILGWHQTHGFCACCGAATAMSQAGWQRRCAACTASHFPRTDPVVIMLITRGNSVLVGRSPGWPEGMYSLLAGFIEPGETIEAAVRREVFEEAGVHVGAVRYLASQPWPFPSSLMLGCAGEALSETLTIDPVEIEDARWVTREDMMAVVSGERTDMLPAREGAIAHFLIRNWLADRLD